MRDRHLTHQQFALAAIDDVIFRSGWTDWIDLRCAILDTLALLGKIERVCCAHVSDPYAQRHHF